MATKPGTARAGQVELRGTLGEQPAFVHGTPRIWRNEPEILVHAIWVGTAEPESQYTGAEASFDLADELLYYWWGTDGAARSLHRSLRLPELIDVPAVQLHYGDVPGGRIAIGAEVPLPIEHFEAQLDAFQRLLTLAAGLPSQWTTLTLTSEDGHAVKVFGRGEGVAAPSQLHDPRTALFRMGGANAQTIIDRWWAMMADLRPVPQVLSAVITSPSYIDTDFLLYATALDRLSAEWVAEETPGFMTETELSELRRVLGDSGIRPEVRGGLLRNAPSFQARLESLAGALGEEIWSVLNVDMASWLTAVKQHRNTVAHSSAMNMARRDFVDSGALRVLRDVTRVVTMLVVAKHLGVEDRALLAAAGQLRQRRISLHRLGRVAFLPAGLAPNG